MEDRVPVLENWRCNVLSISATVEANIVDHIAWPYNWKNNLNRPLARKQEYSIFWHHVILICETLDQFNILN